MVNKTLQFRDGTTAQHATFTGAAAELSVDTSNNSLVVHDGTTAGGFEAARKDFVNVLSSTKDTWVDSAGTADAITATYSPAITLTDGQIAFVRAGFANATTAPTFAPNGLTAHTIVKAGGTALAAGDIAGNGHELILRYDLTGTRWELLNPDPANISAGPTSGTVINPTTGATQTFSGIPAGTTNIILSVSELSHSATGYMEVRIGDSGGLEATGYKGFLDALDADGVEALSTGFRFMAAGFANTHKTGGQMQLTLIDAATFTWSAAGNFGISTSARGSFVGGIKALTAELTQIAIFTDGTSFNAGKVNILYW